MRCDGCKHWQADSDNQEWEARKAGFGECLAVRQRWTIMDEASDRLARDTEADKEQYETVRIEALKASRVYVQDGSQYRAELYTAPDFFCALFSAS